MIQQGLDFGPKAAVESVVQLSLGFVRQIPYKYLGEQLSLTRVSRDAMREHKEAIIIALQDLRLALAALDAGLGFDPSRFEVPTAVKPRKE